MVIEVKEKFEKTRNVKKNQKNRFYGERNARNTETFQSKSKEIRQKL